MKRQLQFKLQSQTVNNKFWKDYVRQILVKQNKIKKNSIGNKFLVQPDFTGVGHFWPNTDFNEVVAQICKSYINQNLFCFDITLGRISLNSFRRVTSYLSGNCRFLTTLALSFTCIGDESVKFIIEAQWRYITEFLFNANNITSKGIKQFRKCEWKFIKLVALAANPLKNLGVKQFIKLHWKGLELLCLRNIGLTDDGAKILARAQWPKLMYLDMSENLFTREAMPHILRANWNTLISIMFNHNHMNDIKENTQNLERKPNHDFISFGSDQWEDQTE